MFSHAIHYSRKSILGGPAAGSAAADSLTHVFLAEFTTDLVSFARCPASNTCSQHQPVDNGADGVGRQQQWCSTAGIAPHSDSEGRPGTAPRRCAAPLA